MLVEGKIKSIVTPAGLTKSVIYEKATAYWDFKLNGFFQAMVDGKVLIDFDARTQGESGTALRNHGTKFRININDLNSIYEHSKKIT